MSQNFSKYVDGDANVPIPIQLPSHLASLETTGPFFWRLSANRLLPPKLKILKIENGEWDLLSRPAAARLLTNLPDTIEDLDLTGAGSVVIPPQALPHLRTLKSNNSTVVGIENLLRSLDSWSLGDSEQVPLDLVPRNLSTLKLYMGSDSKTFDVRALPQNLKELRISTVSVADLRFLPRSLRRLTLSIGPDTAVQHLTGLPEMIEELDISGGVVVLGQREEYFEGQPLLADIGSLPHGLKKLKISGCKLESIEQLPSGLLELQLEGAGSVQYLENLPRGLQVLGLSKMTVDKIEKILPDSLQKLIVRGTTLHDIRGLPASLREIEVDGEAISNLDNLPKSLQILKLYGIPSTMRNLPSLLHRLEIYGHISRTELRYLPGSVRALVLKQSPDD
jgi:hypothetical protein